MWCWSNEMTREILEYDDKEINSEFTSWSVTFYNICSTEYSTNSIIHFRLTSHQNPLTLVSSQILVKSIMHHGICKNRLEGDTKIGHICESSSPSWTQTWTYKFSKYIKCRWTDTILPNMSSVPVGYSKLCNEFRNTWILKYII